MTNFLQHPDGTFFVSLSRLTARLRAHNLRAHQWSVRTVKGCILSRDGSYSAFALIGYSNPDPNLLPNMVVFAAPLVELGGNTRGQPEWIVCFSRTWLIPVSTSRFWNGCEYQSDPEWDFRVVWSVLDEEFCREGSALPSYFFDEVKSEAQSSRLKDGRTYAKALATHLNDLVRESGRVPRELDHDKHGKFLLCLRGPQFPGEERRVLSLACFNETTANRLSAAPARLRFIQGGLGRSLLNSQRCLDSGSFPVLPDATEQRTSCPDLAPRREHRTQQDSRIGLKASYFPLAKSFSATAKM